MDKEELAAKRIEASAEKLRRENAKLTLAESVELAMASDTRNAAAAFGMEPNAYQFTQAEVDDVVRVIQEPNKFRFVVPLKLSEEFADYDKPKRRKETSGERKALRKAKKLSEDEGISGPEALDRVLAEDPSLYQEANR